MAEESINADAMTRAAAAAAQAPDVDWVAFARTGAELARRSLEAFLEREGLAGTDWDPRDLPGRASAPSAGISTDTLLALEEHDRRTGQFQSIATMATRYEEAVAEGAADADEWRADVVGAVEQYGLAGTLVDPRGALPAAQLTPTGRIDQAYLADAARERVSEIEVESEALVATGGTRNEAIDVALYRFADGPSVDVEQRVTQLLDPAQASVPDAAQLPLQARMEQAYLEGYDTRIKTGLAYAAGDDAARVEIGESVLADKVSTYDALDRITATVLTELPDVTFFYEELLDEPLSQNTERALVEAAGIAGRWSELDAAVDSQLEVIDSRAREMTHAHSVHAGDPAEAEMRYLDPDLQRATQALPQIERDNTVRAARALTEAQPRQARAPVFERLRERRDERRAQTASLTDPGRQTTAPQQAHTIK